MPEVWIKVKIDKTELETFKKDMKEAGKKVKEGFKEEKTGGGGGSSSTGTSSDISKGIMSSEITKNLISGGTQSAVSAFQSIRGTKLGIETSRDAAMAGSDLLAAIGNKVGGPALGNLLGNMGKAAAGEAMDEGVNKAKTVQQKAFAISETFQKMGIEYSQEEMRSDILAMNEYEKKKIANQKQITKSMNEMREFSTEQSLEDFATEIADKARGSDKAKLNNMRKS